MTAAAALAAAVASGLLYSRAFPDAAARPLAFVALVPLLVALRGGSGRRALALAGVFGVVAAWGLNDWFPRAVATYYLQPWAVGIALFLAVAGLTASPYFMLFALAYRALARRPGAGLPLAAAAAWVAAELARARLLGGDPWGLLGYSQVSVLPLMQVADLGGVYAVGFVLAAVNAALAELWLAARRRTAPLGAALAGVGLAGACVALALAYGSARLAAEAHADTPADARTVAVVQANLDLGSQWNEEFYGENLARYLALTWDAVHDRSVALAVWPENALTFFLADEPGYRTAIRRVLEPDGVELLTGGPRQEGHWPPAYFNSAFVIAPTGTITEWYDKERLLPFAEYFPFRIDLLRRRFGRVQAFTSGSRIAPVPTAAGSAGILICNEALFAEPAAERVRAGAALLVNLANDSWVGDAKYSAQAFDMAVLRAVEQRRWLVRASTSGPSAIVAPTGAVIARTRPFTAEAIVAAVVPRAARTPYARVGDLFAVACAVVAIVGATVGRA